MTDFDIHFLNKFLATFFNTGYRTIKHVEEGDLDIVLVRNINP